jgi:glycosyltransferase involved in cell wall biosynthesis
MPHDANPKLTVSVIIPTFNRAALVTQAIDSALSQTRVPDEIVVVDDGSTDETQEVLSQYGDAIRVIRQENRGRSAARNEGIQNSRGDLIVFLDSDDLFTPTSIEQRVQIFERSSDVSVVYGDMHVIDAGGKHLGLHRQYMPGPRPSGFVLSELALRSFVLMSVMIRRSALGDHRFDTTLDQCEDYDLWRRVAASCQFKYSEEPVAFYRIHDANTIVTQPRKIKECELLVQQRIYAMPEFNRLARRQKARAYCHHGAKNAALGNGAASRRYFAHSVGTFPFSPTAWALLLLSYCQPSLLSRAVALRRKLVAGSLVDAPANARAPQATASFG